MDFHSKTHTHKTNWERYAIVFNWFLFVVNWRGKSNSSRWQHIKINKRTTWLNIYPFAHSCLYFIVFPTYVSQWNVCLFPCTKNFLHTFVHFYSLWNFINLFSACSTNGVFGPKHRMYPYMVYLSITYSLYMKEI